MRWFHTTAMEYNHADLISSYLHKRPFPYTTLHHRRKETPNWLQNTPAICKIGIYKTWNLVLFLLSYLIYSLIFVLNTYKPNTYAYRHENVT